MKITKKMRKAAKGMNAITKQNSDKGFKPVTYNGSEALTLANRKIPPYGKLGNGTPYVNQANFDGSRL